MNDVSNFNAAVDIIVPYHGQYERVTQLLQSIFRLTRSNYYQVCIVDDSSPNRLFGETMRLNAAKNATRRRQPNVVNFIRTERHLGFGGACRVGLEATQSPYVCFINSDCLIEDSNWLRSMGESLLRLKEQNVRMVAPVTNNAVGGDLAQEGNKHDRSGGDVVLGPDSFLTLYCFLCHRDLFGRCGGFLREYPLGGYEDQEIAHRMNRHGFKQAVCRWSWIYHEGEATFRNVLRNNPSASDVLAENRQRCIEDMRKSG